MLTEVSALHYSTLQAEKMYSLHNLTDEYQDERAARRSSEFTPINKSGSFISGLNYWSPLSLGKRSHDDLSVVEEVDERSGSEKRDPKRQKLARTKVEDEDEGMEEKEDGDEMEEDDKPVKKEKGGKKERSPEL